LLLLLQMPLDDIRSLMDETAEAKEYQVSHGDTGADCRQDMGVWGSGACMRRLERLRVSIW
jgi:hypothetical protein